MKYHRILLKLSGEALSGEKGFGFDEATVRTVARQVKEAHDQGVEIGIVIEAEKFGGAGAPTRWTGSRRTRSGCWQR